MRILTRIAAAALAASLCTGLLAGCKVVDIPDDVYFRPSSSSSSSFVQDLTPVETAEAVDSRSILYYDALNGATLFVCQNPDGTDSLIYEKDGARTRLYTGDPERGVLYPLLNDAGTKAAFVHMNRSGELAQGEFIGEMMTCDLSSGEVRPEGFYVRSYVDNPRGFYWYADDTLFISSGMKFEDGQKDCIGFFNLDTQVLNNIIGGEHVPDQARQGVISPDGRLISYSGYYKGSTNFVHCIFDTETGETSYWYNKASSGLSTDVLSMYPYLDNERVLKVRTYRLPLDADGNVIEESAEAEEDLYESPESIPEDDSSSQDEASGESAAPQDGGAFSSAESSEAAGTGTEDEQYLTVNSIFTLNLLTGEMEMLLEHAYRPCLNADRSKLFFRYTAYAPDVEDKTNLQDRVFCYDVASGEVEEVTESMGMTDPFEILQLDQRIMQK